MPVSEPDGHAVSAGTSTAETGSARLELVIGVPLMRHGVIARDRLEPLRTAALDSTAVLVSAPAGYGKSTLVAQWLDRDPRVSGWVQLGHADNDPVVLITHITAAIEGAKTASREQLQRALSAQPPRVHDVVLPLLAAALADSEPFVLVLDDAHAVTAEDSRAVLEFLVNHVPAGSQLTVVTRGDAPFRVARMRADGDLLEIGARDLELTAEETRAVAAAGGLELRPQEAGALCERTEGWVAAVVLAALSLRGRENAAARAAGLSGDQAQIADYLLEEVLERQPEHLRSFLLGTSVLEQMTAPLCDAVLGTSGAAASLEALSRSDGFLVPLDDRRRWFRYHHLFRDLLRTELDNRHPGLAEVYLRRAGEWCEQHGTPGEAFRYAHQGGDLALAGRVALAHREELSRLGQSETVWLWIDGCTDEEIASDPQLALAAAWVLLFRGDISRARQFIEAAGHGRLDGPSADGASSLGSSLASVRSLVAPGGIGEMRRDGEDIYAAESAAGSRWMASGCRAIGIADVLLGRPGEAIGQLREGIALLAESPELAHFRVVGLGYLAFASADLGDAAETQRWAVQAAQVAEDHHLAETPGAVIAAVARAHVHEHRGDHPHAEREIASVRSHWGNLPGVTWLKADLAIRCANICLGLGDAPGALEFAQRAGDALQGYADPGVLPARLAGVEERIRQGEAFGLSGAELRIIGFLPTHLSLQEIADRLFLARSTVKTHVARIYDKLGVEGRTEAVELIEQLHLGAPPPVRL